jgi:magnesium-transporting ATPase (P-type)
VTDGGLSKSSAAARLAAYGANVLTPAKSRTLLSMIWEQLYNIITAILLSAAIVAGVFKEWIELGFILAVVVVNVFIGVYQEGRAEAATSSIRKMVSSSAIAVRNGRKVVVDASDLVPGDVIHLTSGDRLPADVRWLEVSNLMVTEAMLTGESASVAKSDAAVPPGSPLGDRTCMGFTGTLIFTGQGVGLVVATGDAAEIGKINGLIARVSAVKTPLLVQIEGFGFALSLLCLGVAFVTFCVAFWADGMHVKEALEAAVGVAVALIPEGLPTVVTICLAMGVQSMARVKAVIRQLPAVETLGAVTCICSDKTGTLTKNEMTAIVVHAPTGVYRVTGTGYTPDGAVLGGGLDAALSAEESAALRQLLLPAVLCNEATLMPLVSAHAQTLLAAQDITLPQLAAELPHAPAAAPVFSSSGRGTGAGGAALITDLGAAAASMMPASLEAASSPVGAAILAAMTSTLRVVKWDTTGDPTEANRRRRCAPQRPPQKHALGARRPRTRTRHAAQSPSSHLRQRRESRRGPCSARMSQ